jgi:hypothetical protein
MSLYQTINKIAPHVLAPNIKEGSQSKAAPFSAYASRIKNNKKQGNRKPNSKPDSSNEADNASANLPEIFDLVASPDFSELFWLTSGKKGKQIMMSIKKVRKQRGVSKMIPVSDAKKDLYNECKSYLNTALHFTIPKGKKFTGTL